MASKALIDEFLAQKRITIVGVSRDPKDFSRALFKEFRERGYEVIPVNPNAEEIDGLPCYANVTEIPSAVDGALLLTNPAETYNVVVQCAEAGIKRVWMHRGEGIGAVSSAAVDYCEEKGIAVVDGHCPFMFLPETPFFHRIHGFFLKMGGTYPV